jgi:hypothetical protein
VVLGGFFTAEGAEAAEGFTTKTLRHKDKIYGKILSAFETLGLKKR